jgi:putative sterol carrier protein
MAAYAFLSPEWIDAARALHAANPDEEAPTIALRMNLVVQEVPFGEGRLEAHLDTTTGVMHIDLGHLESADVRISLDYETAKAVLVDQNAEAAMSAFMAGKVRVEGDMTKLLNYQAAPPTPRQQELTALLRALTE